MNGVLQVEEWSVKWKTSLRVAELSTSTTKGSLKSIVQHPHDGILERE